MKKGFVIATAFVLCAGFLVGSAMAQLEALTSLDIFAVKKVRIEKKDDGYWANVITVLKNGSDLNVKLRNFKFDMSFEYPPKQKAKEAESKEGSESKKPDLMVLKFGAADVAEVEIPKAATDGPTLKDMTMKVFIGPENEDTVRRILQFISLVGDPGGEDVRVVLKGKGEIGREVEKGWIYQGNMILELKLAPQLQREWLFK